MARTTIHISLPITEKQQAVCLIVGGGEATYRQAANWLGITREAAKKRVQRARQRVKRLKAAA